MISIRHLKKAYPNVTPLSDVNVGIEKGEAYDEGMRLLRTVGEMLSVSGKSIICS